EARAAGEVGGPVARIHVAHRDHVARAGEGERLAPERDPTGHDDGVVRLGQAGQRARIAPPGEILDRRGRRGAHRVPSAATSTTCASSAPIMCRSPADSTVTGPPNGWRSHKVTTTPGTRPSIARYRNRSGSLSSTR